MRLTASDFMTYWRPSVCELRVFLHENGEPEAEPGAFDEVMRRLGIRHEQEHLATLGPYLDLSDVLIDERVGRTLEAIASKVPVIYQPAFVVRQTSAGTDVEIVGAPDFLILDGDGYVIRDCKMSRRIDAEIHPEIVVQVQLYGWLFERSTGVLAKELQVYNGMKEIVRVEDDGGEWALAVLENLLRLKQLDGEPYEPVGWSKCGGCGFNARCMEKAEADHSVALVPYVDQNLARTLRGIGVSTRKELLSKFDFVTLSELKRPHGQNQRRVGKTAERIIQFAQAMETREEKILCAPAIPLFPNYVMFDLEGMPPYLDEIENIYLWGIQVYGAKPSEFMPAVAGFGPDGDRDCWLAFLSNAEKIFDTCGDIPFVHWAPYEKTKLTLYMSRYGDVDGIAERVKANLFDLLTVARNSIVIPVPSFSLKVIEQYIGFKRSQSEFGGQWAMAIFIEATETSDEGKRKQLMDEILKYNEEDLAATWGVFQWLKTKVPTTNPARA
ncbi:MAG: TM0106 family RecB-like putative nuclease [Candidatus Acidiferrales bacterium]